MNRVAFSFTRLLLIAHNTWREAVRQKVFNLLLLLALALVMGAQYLRDFTFGSPELRFIADFGFGAMGVFGTVLAVIAVTQLFFSEIENGTVHTLLAKPVWRTEFIVGKFLGVTAITAVFCLLLTGLLAAVIWTRETALMRDYPEAFAGGRATNYTHLAVVGLFLWLKLGVLAAFTLLIASYAQTQLFTIIMGFAVFVICHLQYLAHEASARAGSLTARVASEFLARIFPNFQLFNFADSLGAGDGLPWNDAVRVALYAVGYMAAACALAVYCFRRREI